MARDPKSFGGGAAASRAAAPAAGTPAAPGSLATAGRLTTADLAAFLQRLPALDTAVSDVERVDQLGLLESIKHARRSHRRVWQSRLTPPSVEAQAAAGMPARQRGTGVAAQVALARRESPSRGSRHLGLARALVHEMPHTMGHLAAGRVSEWRATIVGRETACLSLEDRAVVDAALAADLPTLGDRQAESRAKALAAQLRPPSLWPDAPLAPERTAGSRFGQPPTP